MRAQYPLPHGPLCVAKDLVSQKASMSVTFRPFVAADACGAGQHQRAILRLWQSGWWLHGLRMNTSHAFGGGGGEGGRPVLNRFFRKEEG